MKKIKLKCQKLVGILREAAEEKRKWLICDICIHNIHDTSQNAIRYFLKRGNVS